jgi:hypothetical protein
MDVRSDIHAALEAVTPPAPHLPDVVMGAVRRGQRPGPALPWTRAAIGALGMLLILVIGIGVIGLRASRGGPTPAGSAAPAQPTSWSGTLDAGQSSPRLALPVRFGQEVTLATSFPSSPGTHMQVLLYDPAGRLARTLDSSQPDMLLMLMPIPGRWSVVVRDVASPPSTVWRVDVAFTKAPLVVTTWLKDPSVTAGPYPGYRPQVSAINPGMVASARAVPDGPAGSWKVEGTWDANGAVLFSNLTTAAAQSCPGQRCPEAHVTTWAGLTQDDVDHWNERASAVYRPVADGGELASDAVVVAPISGGTWPIAGNYTRQEARDIASWLASSY